MLSLEPEIGEAFEIPATFADFHEVELAEHPDEAIASEVYAEWRAAAAAPGSGACRGRGPVPLPPDKCVGLKVPLFLGGTASSVDNMEITDMEVYWSLCAQLLMGTAHLPSGTAIDSVSISDGPG